MTQKKSSDYQVMARKYRPQTFAQVLGQEAIVTTLKNAIIRNSLAHAYLFCGSRGTGKTTLARIFAKALNCQNPTDHQEPCNICSSCREITSGNSLDVLEIDGASHRGIDDIRQINETVGYATASGKYKIYIIDEVHMLTKEAFNALLKTLEEPPPKVKFLFATTEPHKVLPTILSRCQRFNLNRIPVEIIVKKLQEIAQELTISAQEDALRMLANRAEGGLRDAESLFDQILAFHEGEVTTETVASVLGMMSRDSFFALDRAGKENNLSMAFDIAHQVFSEGKDVSYYIESLTDHFRTILLFKLVGKSAPSLSLTAKEQELYEQSAQLYNQEQCLGIIDFLIEAQNQKTASSRIALEALLLRILRSHQRIPIDFLVRRLLELEQKLGNTPRSESVPLQVAAESPVPLKPKEEVVAVPSKPVDPSLSEDPTPTKAELGIKPKKAAQKNPPATPAPAAAPSMAVELGARPSPEALIAATKEQGRYDTVLQFAMIELEGRIQKNK